LISLDPCIVKILFDPDIRIVELATNRCGDSDLAFSHAW